MLQTCTSHGCKGCKTAGYKYIHKAMSLCQAVQPHLFGFPTAVNFYAAIEKGNYITSSFIFQLVTVWRQVCSNRNLKKTDCTVIRWLIIANSLDM